MKDYMKYKRMVINNMKLIKHEIKNNITLNTIN